MKQLHVDDLRPGSVVRLVSGSPKMAVTEVAPAAEGSSLLEVHVVWWSDRLGVCMDKFAPELLVYPGVLADEGGAQ